MRTLLVAIVLAGLMTAPANAVFINVIEDNGNFVTDFSGDSELDVDIIWNNFDPVWLEAVLEPGDVGPWAFSGFQHNLTGQDWTDFHIDLEGGPTWGEVNLIESNGAIPVVGVMVDGGSVWLDPIVPAHPAIDIASNALALTFGEPDGDIDPGVDWFINLNGPPIPGTTFTIHYQPTSTIPEPVTAMLGLMGLGALGLAMRRRR